MNPNNQNVVVDDPRFFGLAEEAVTRHNASAKFRLFGTQANIDIGNESGGSNFQSGHIVLGSYHIWVENATGKVRIKNGVPVNDADGTVIGTQV